MSKQDKRNEVWRTVFFVSPRGKTESAKKRIVKKRRPCRKEERTLKRLLLILLALLLLTASLASCTIRKSEGTETTATDAAEATTVLPQEGEDETDAPASTKNAEATPASTEAPATAVQKTTVPETTAPETTAPGDPDDDNYTKNY